MGSEHVNEIHCRFLTALRALHAFRIRTTIKTDFFYACMLLFFPNMTPESTTVKSSLACCIIFTIRSIDFLENENNLCRGAPWHSVTSFFTVKQF